MGIFDWLFGKKLKDTHQKIWFPFYILEKGDKIPQNKWFQKDTSRNKSFVNYRGNWSSDWKYAPIPFFGPILGGLLGGAAYKMLYENDLQIKYWFIILIAVIVLVFAVVKVYKSEKIK